MKMSERQEKQEKEKLQQFKEILQNQKTELKQLLLNELIAAKKEKINIFQDDFKDYIISKTIEDYQAGFKNNLFKQHFEKSYKNLIVTFLISNYYTIAGQAERIAKKQDETINNYKNQLAIKKLEQQREKVQAQLQKEKREKIQQQEKMALQLTSSILIAFIKGFTTVLGSIIIVIGSIIAGFLSGMCKGQ